MSKMMPQEIEVFYLLPAMRRELAKVFVHDYKISQKDAAGLLGITESAISQYLTSKRASEIRFSDKELKRVKSSAAAILKDKKNIVKHLYDLSVILRGSDAMCVFHKAHDKGVAHNCTLCMANSP
ncbi:hypothetical protein HYV84_04105 [Candidatus Woesearchaeota archaeon]|nr:hypothetical protein [Candidatus Woesearchaeota archaeon]